MVGCVRETCWRMRLQALSSLHRTTPGSAFDGSVRCWRMSSPFARIATLWLALSLKPPPRRRRM